MSVPTAIFGNADLVRRVWGVTETCYKDGSTETLKQWPTPPEPTS
jgi:hypothetical protein